MLFKRLCLYGVFSLAVWLVPSPGLAQSTIAGVVTDDTGGVLPGVTVEVASPALIEKSEPSSPTIRADTRSPTCVPVNTASHSRSRVSPRLSEKASPSSLVPPYPSMVNCESARSTKR